jgi:nitrogen fixation NifU-like protein
MEQTQWLYTETVRDHFFNPRNILINEEGYEAHGIGSVGNPQCGDLMKMWIKVDPKEDKIIECKWKTFGCASAIGSTSMLSVMVTENGGMKLDDVLKITPQQIMKRLGGLPSRKIHCSVLGDKALQAAIHDYFKRSDQAHRIIEIKAHVMCTCLNVSDKDIEEAFLDGATTFEKVQEHTKCGTNCGKCKDDIIKFIDGLRQKYPVE